MLSSGGGGGPPPELDGAIAFLDFVNGFYYAGGSEHVVGDLLGGAFDAGEISGSGMYVDGTNTNRPTIAGAFLSDLLDNLPEGMTILFEMTAGHSELGGFLLYIGDNNSYFDADAWNVVSINGAVWDEGCRHFDFHLWCRRTQDCRDLQPRHRRRQSSNTPGATTAMSPSLRTRLMPHGT